MRRQDAPRQPGAPLGVVDLVVHVGQVGLGGPDPVDPGERAREMGMAGMRLSRNASTIQTSTPPSVAERAVVEAVGVGRVGKAADAKPPAVPRPCSGGTG